MKKILTYNLIFSLLLSFIYSNNALAANLPQGKVIDNSVANTAVFVNQPVIKVELAKNNQNVIVGNSDVSTVCKSGTSWQSQQGLTQAASGINLNQPANCFSLKISTQVPAAVKLFVNILQAASTKIILAIQPQTLTSNNFMPAPLVPGGLPVLPAVIFLLVVEVVLLKKKLVEKIAKLKLFENRDFITNRFQILKC